MTAYRFNQDATPADWSALPRSFKKGDEVVLFTGHTYGLYRDDLVYLKIETVPCVLPENAPDGPFFTVPVDLLVDEDGREPCGDYMTREKLDRIMGRT